MTALSRRIGLSFLPIVGLCACTEEPMRTVSATSPSQAIKSAPAPHGFTLPRFQSGYPAAEFIYEGEKAKELTREILPVAIDQVTRVVASETVALPAGVHTGFTFDVAFKPRRHRDAICEEPHALVTIHYEKADLSRRLMQITIRDGHIEDHTFDRLGWSGRYLRLPEKFTSPEALAKTCQQLAADTSDWERADSIQEFIAAQGRVAKLLKAIRSTPKPRISCVDFDNTPSRYGREKLLAILEETPLLSSEQFREPGEDILYVFHYSQLPQEADEYGVDLYAAHYTSLSVTMRLGPHDSVREIRFHFRFASRPVT